jgi:hypothetical protein
MSSVDSVAKIYGKKSAGGIHTAQCENLTIIFRQEYFN